QPGRGGRGGERGWRGRAGGGEGEAAAARTSLTAAASAASVVSAACRAAASPASRTAREGGAPMLTIGVESCTPSAAARRAIIGLVRTSEPKRPAARLSRTAAGGSTGSGR